MEESGLHITNVMKELSDVKRDLAVNTNETANIKKVVDKIDNNVERMRNDFVTHREFDEKNRELEESIKPFKKAVWSALSVVSLALFGAIWKLIVK